MRALPLSGRYRANILLLASLITLLHLPLLDTRGIFLFQNSEVQATNSVVLEDKLDKIPEIVIEIKAAEYIPPKPKPKPQVIPTGNRGYNHFPFGQCTWGVANLRYVPWRGHAYMWYANAAPYRPRGSQPRVGAIMVSWESPLGHVALVTSVQANGVFTVREMNNSELGGWGRYNYRTIYPGTVRIIGFIY